jgi:hypothetical protein
MGDIAPSFKFLKRDGHTGSSGPKHHGKVFLRERNLMIIHAVVGQVVMSSKSESSGGKE